MFPETTILHFCLSFQVGMYSWEYQGSVLVLGSFWETIVGDQYIQSLGDFISGYRISAACL